jgi:hypothetical protein
MTDNIPLFIVVGFVAQMIDGSLGMAYGVSSNTLLLSLGLMPAMASSSVHAAEVVTTAVSGASHWRLGNVDKRLFLRLLIPGVIGGAAGAYLLTSLPGEILKPYISAYLLVMGAVILAKAIRGVVAAVDSSHWTRGRLVPLGLVGGVFDAIGGGGWGPVVTSTLLASGNNPRFTIDSVNLVEFFVTLAESITFILTIGLSHWKVILGLMIGGVVAAPLAAVVCRKIPARTLMIIVGVLIIGLSIRTIILALLG